MRHFSQSRHNHFANGKLLSAFNIFLNDNDKEVCRRVIRSSQFNFASDFFATNLSSSTYKCSYLLIF